MAGIQGAPPSRAAGKHLSFMTIFGWRFECTVAEMGCLSLSLASACNACVPLQVNVEIPYTCNCASISPAHAESAAARDCAALAASIHKALRQEHCQPTGDPLCLQHSPRQNRGVHRTSTGSSLGLAASRDMRRL